MRWADLLTMAGRAIATRRSRSVLSLLGIAVGVAAVVLLTSIGEGARVYILSQFTQFGTNLLTVTPGKTKKVGIPGVLGGTTHKLTLDDAEAIRGIGGIEKVVPVAMGNVRMEVEDRGRSVTAAMPALWKFTVRQGTFLPGGDVRVRRPLTVLRPKLKRELFRDSNPLGKFVRIGGFRYQVIGVMASKGNLLGFDIDDAVYIPVASALTMFNMDELVEIQVAFSQGRELSPVVADLTQVLRERHRGEEDFTIVTQAAMLETFDNVMGVVTIAVGAIAGISLFVGAIGILTVMWMTVRERRSEIGLFKAIGATSSEIYRLFLFESLILAMIGGGVGLVCGLAVVQFVPVFVPELPVSPHSGYLAAAVFVSALTGIGPGVLPARRAASIDPVEALHSI